jgi:hypothetical protein
MWKIGRAGKSLGIVGLLLCLEAQAGSWGGFDAAFPMFPCQDGWMGCLVTGQHLDPELQKDTAGRMIPSDARIGWFDLKATASFSPFPGLSAYEAGGNDAVASADPAPVEPENDGLAEADNGRAAEATLVSERAVADAEAARAAQLEAAREAREADARRRQADLDAQRQRQEEETARKEAQAAIERAKSASNAAAAEERERLKREADVAAARATEMERQRKASEAAAAAEKAAQAAAQKKAAEEAERLRQAEAARTAAQEREAAALAALKVAEEQKQREAEEARRKAEQETAKVGAPVPAPSGADGDCSDTVKLEPTALLGKLTEGVIGCLETRLANASKPTDKKKISGILMADAWAKSDKARWETLIKRHLDDIDQSDPDLCYKYALHLSRQGASRASGVIRWANVALENRTVWIGETYTSRVYSLYKVRAAASQSLWQAAEESHAKSPSDETRDNVEKYRNMTKVNAREWYEYAKSAGKDAQTALQLCMSAAGTSDYCQAE